MSDDTPNEFRRRGQDTIVDMLRQNVTDVRDELHEHVRNCAAQQRWILRGMIGLCGWVVLHSPEVLTLAGKVAAVVGK